MNTQVILGREIPNYAHVIWCTCYGYWAFRKFGSS
jgi:hypothetical protein